MPTSSLLFANLLAFTPGELAWVFGVIAVCVIVILWPLTRMIPLFGRKPPTSGPVTVAPLAASPDSVRPSPGTGGVSRGRLNPVLFALLALIFLQSVLIMQKDSPTYDESNHVACGYSYLKTGDLRMSLAQPPLARILMALPLLVTRPNLNLNTESWRNADDWAFAREFMFHSGNDADSILFWARMTSVLLCLLLGLFVFKWSGELYGPRAAWFSLVLYAFSPNILAHGRLATTEMALASFSFISGYYFWRFLERPGRKFALLSALFLGLGLSSKYSGLIFVISFLVIALVWGLRRSSSSDGVIRPGRDARRLKQLLGYCVVILVISGLIAVVSSGLTMRPVLDYPGVQGDLAKPGESGGFAFRNPRSSALARDLAATVPLPRYLVGALFNHLHFKRGHPAYLRGQWKLGGWWYYFPVAFLVKEPLPVFLLMGLAAYLAFRRRRQMSSAELVLTCIPVVTLLWSMAFVRLNIGFRHLLFILPFVYVLLGSVVARPGSDGACPEDPDAPGQGGSDSTSGDGSRRDWLKPRFMLSLLLLGWFCLESAVVSPHHLAYFNEVAGGPRGGVDWLVDSNLDWGQDLKRLRDYVDHHRVDSLRLLYFGTAEPSYYGLQYSPLTLSDFRDLEYSDTYQQYFGEKWAVSVTSYASLLRYAPWLKKIEGHEDTRIGFSIFVFSPEKLVSVLFPEVEMEASARTAE